MQQRQTKAKQPATQLTQKIIQDQVFLTYGNLQFKGSPRIAIMQNALVFLMLNVSKSGSITATILAAKGFCILAHSTI